jgi:hypothetical protein
MTSVGVERSRQQKVAADGHEGLTGNDVELRVFIFDE